ncbi:putative oxalocrotonate tautomerase [Mycena rosella]|uniref:Oxalocrotonate tautomerase n=1 Tax=Mycena rosella TaxID=1033263 RepID=A0AAD7GYM8_MYCRO|nr:putative oxalocrotonate tautomerase [Mycena rosella]
MPLHRIFVPKGLYTPEDKEAISQAITAVYTNPPASLPAFYVIVLFIDLDPANIFVGGKSTDRFVRIAVEHIARNFTDDALKRVFMDRYEQVLEPFTKGRGIDWEVQVADQDRLLWNMNGMAPPQENTEEEKIWKKENRAVPPEEIEALRAQGRF